MAQNIQSISDDVHTLTVALKKAKADGLSGLGPEVARLNEQLEALKANLERLRDARSNLIDELVAEVANVAGNALQSLRVCSLPAENEVDVSSAMVSQLIFNDRPPTAALTP